MYLLGEAARDKEAAKAVQCSLEYTTLRRVTQVSRGDKGGVVLALPTSTASEPTNCTPWQGVPQPCLTVPCCLPAPCRLTPVSYAPWLPPPQATEIYYDPDPKTTIIEEDREWVEGYFDLNEGAGRGGGRLWEGAGVRGWLA